MSVVKTLNNVLCRAYEFPEAMLKNGFCPEWTENLGYWIFWAKNAVSQPSDDHWHLKIYLINDVLQGFSNQYEPNFVVGQLGPTLPYLCAWYLCDIWGRSAKTALQQQFFCFLLSFYSLRCESGECASNSLVICALRTVVLFSDNEFQPLFEMIVVE